jgi:hypothetical protein
MEHHFLRTTLAWLLALAPATGCMMDDDDDDAADEAADDAADDDAADDDAADDDGGSTDGETTDGGSSTGPELHTIDGIVRRTSELAEGEDGIGVLYLGAFAECDHAAQIVGIFVMPAADMSANENEIPFEIQNLSLETVYLASFLDDDGNADQTMPLPDAGDPVLADDVEDGKLTCVEVDVANGNGVVVELNMLED